MRADTRPITLLLDEAQRYLGEDLYRPMLDAAHRAATLATALDSPRLRLKATFWEAVALRLLGDYGGALARLTQVLAWVENPALMHREAEIDIREEVIGAHVEWVACARNLPGLPAAQLFRVLDAAEAWATAADRGGHRASLLLERARLLELQGRFAQAVAAAEQALAIARACSHGLVYPHTTCRWTLADLLRRTDRYADARTHYQAVLDCPDSQIADRLAAHVGLAWCAVDLREGAVARRHAERAVAVAEGLSDDSLCVALCAMVAACRADGAVHEASVAATHQLRVVRRLQSDLHLHFALRDAADVALDRADAAAARAHIAEARPLAEAIDRDNGTTEERDELDTRAARLAALEP